MRGASVSGSGQEMTTPLSWIVNCGKKQWLQTTDHYISTGILKLASSGCWLWWRQLGQINSGWDLFKQTSVQMQKYEGDWADEKHEKMEERKITETLD